MKKFKVFLFVGSLLTLLSVKCEDCEKIRIIHEGNEIVVSANAWDAHDAHGDEFIECVSKD